MKHLEHKFLLIRLRYAMILALICLLKTYNIMQAVFMVQWADSETKTGERKKKAVSFTLSKNG